MSNNESINSKRIAKNTLLLYVRMLFLMAISLYTSRIVLANLGVTDYGVYNAVGGFVAMFHVISGAMATATQRFLSFQIGTKNQDRVTRVFSTSMVIHAFLAFIILVLAESVGLWFLNAKMVFPEDRYIAANWVFQLSIITLIIEVMSVPYYAALIAYEKMSAFAYISILEGILKLIVAFVIASSVIDKLILYAFLLSCISITIRIIYSIYVKRELQYCKNNWRMEKSIRKEMLSFVSWNLIGSTAGIVQEQGISVVLNVFFGAAVNAARGISMQVQHAVSGFVSNFNLAMNPQIVKSYASGDKESMFSLAIRGSKFSFMLMLILSTPIIIKAPYILSIWLVEVPEYASVFVRIILLAALVDSMKHTLVTSVHASGKVKLYQLTNGIFSLLTIPVAYIVLRMGYSPSSALVVSLCVSIVCHFIRLAVLWETIRFPVARYLREVTLRMVILAIITYPLPLICEKYLSETFLRFVLFCVITFLFSLLTCYFFGMKPSERDFVKDRVLDVINKIKK